MGKVLLGVLLASAAWGAAWLLLPREPAPAPECGGMCGPGTQCSEGLCAPAQIEAPPEEPAPAGKKRRHRKRGGGGGGGGGAAADEGSEPEPAALPFTPVDDRHIPHFSNDKAQALDLNAGSERLSESVLDRHFAQITPTIQGCVTTASRHGEVGSGRLSFKLRILPSGKVESVSVKAPASLQAWGIPPCARKAVFDHRFPAFDGASMGVDFAVDID